MTTTWTTWREDLGGLAVIALIGAGAWLGMVRPGAQARQEADRLQLESDLLRSQVAMVQTQLRNANTDLQSITRGLDDAVALRPPEDLNRLVADLNSAAQGAGIVLDRIVPGAMEHLPETTRHRISLSGRGTYAGGVALLRTIRDDFPDVSVTVLSALSNPSDQAAPALLSFEVAWHAQPESGVSSGKK